MSEEQGDTLQAISTGHLENLVQIITSDVLLPCPSCGDTNTTTLQNPDEYAAWPGHCLKCGAEGSCKSTNREATIAWNCRALINTEGKLHCPYCRGKLDE